MNSKVGIIAAGISIAVFIGFFALNFEEEKTDSIFHVTLADPIMYENGVFTDSFEIEVGSYNFEFVPNGDSPQTITITLRGPDSFFMEVFELEGTLHDVGISEYYTWEYIGDNDATIHISSAQKMEITIDPHGNYNGPVSIFLKKIA